MKRQLATAPLSALVLVLGACRVVTEFVLLPVEESTAELCVDGRDSDFDGLTDCQDWNCIDLLPCCDIPEVVLVDDFDSGPDNCGTSECAEANCAELTCGPDPEVWHTWPCPFPTQCEGALRLHKTSCFASGVLSHMEVSLEPGLRVEVDIAGLPEILGYVELALTIQDEAALAGSLAECGIDQQVTGFAALRQRRHGEGFELAALSQGSEIGVSPEISDAEETHTVALGIDRERYVFYSLDGDVFATAPEPLPPTSERAHIALSGLTAHVRFEAVRVQEGLRCHDPTAWMPAGSDIESAVVLSGDSEGGSSFDRDEVFNPAVRETDGGLELFYTGCRWLPGTSDCEPFLLGVGRATGTSGAALSRDGTNPWVIPEDFPEAGLAGIYRGMSVDLLPGEPRRAIAAPTGNVGLYILDEDMQPAFEAVPRDRPVDWDSGQKCCAAIVEQPDGTTYVWYAGVSTQGGEAWRIGLATSTDGTNFERVGGGPVLSVGPPGSFDSEAVLNPTVLYDTKRELFRMWYEGRDYFGKTAIGYAVSTDGMEWHKAPANPVLAPEDAGLASIGGPEVHLADDGRLRAWVHGIIEGESRRRIFAFTNEGALIGGEDE